ncbi:hypothetical protein OIO90_000082 [Microbotryomycetes sp. JL221]|nr:hypothetical protein OIO90_000082 [Microbotryomycetes sp. JL221]
MHDYATYNPPTAVDEFINNWTSFREVPLGTKHAQQRETVVARSTPTPDHQQATPTASQTNAKATTTHSLTVQQHDTPAAEVVTDEPAHDQANQQHSARKRQKTSDNESNSTPAQQDTTSRAANKSHTQNHSTAADPVERKADKSCKSCRQRKARCDRRWPKCGRCTLKGIDCQLGDLVPVEFLQTQPHPAEVRVAELEARVASLERDIASQNMFLPDAARFTQTIDLVARTGGDLETAQRWMQSSEELDSNRMNDKIAQIVPTTVAERTAHRFERKRLAGRLSAEARARQPALRQSFVLHLLEQFFSACCASLHSFKPWHTKIEALFNVNTLDAAERVAVATFCAIGARTTPHSALLGVSDLVTPDLSAIAMSGIRREQACRALNAEALDLYERLAIADDVSYKSLEATLVVMQNCIFNELVPRRSRTMVRTALGQYKDLFDAAKSDAERQSLVMQYGMSILHGDSVTSAYARRNPLITGGDLAIYFRGIGMPDLTSDNLSHQISSVLPSNAEPDHTALFKVTIVVLRWILQTLREFSSIASPRSGQQPLNMASIFPLWSALDQLHASIPNVQHLLMNVDRLPQGCEQDGCKHLHLRFITRMSREVDNVTSLVHSLLLERRSGAHGMEDDVGEEWIEESERRVRKGLKLAACDAHQVYYLTWQLELMPTWTTLAVQRHGELDGPLSPELELTETELDWIDKGLQVALGFHPVADRRLAQLRAGRRREPRPEASPSRATFDRPGLELPDALKRTLRNAVPNWN